MNTTLKNHSKFISLLRDIEPGIMMDKLYEENKSTGVAYFELIKENKLQTMEDIFMFFLGDYFQKIHHGTFNKFNAFIAAMIIEFFETNFSNHDYFEGETIAGKKVFGNTGLMNLDRAILRKKAGEEETLSLEPYHKETYADYETAIEIETTYVYAVPFARLVSVMDEKIILVTLDEDDEVEFYKSSLRYDERAYGTHYM